MILRLPAQPMVERDTLVRCGLGLPETRFLDPEGAGC